MKTITLPEAVKGMTNATVRRWLKAPHQAIKAGEDLLELEIEEAFIRLQSKSDGNLEEIIAKEGVTVATGAPLAKFSDGDKTTAAAASTSSAAREASASTTSPPSGGAVTPVLLPQVGNSMEEGTIQNWRVKVGDRIEVGQILYEMETDKASVEVEATDAGRLARIVAQPGDTLPIKTPVAYLAEKDEDVAAFLAASPGGARAPAPAPTQAAPPSAARSSTATTPTSYVPPVELAGGRIKASPAARRIAQEKGLDLRGVGAGSGPGGRIVTRDLANAGPVLAPAGGQPVRRPIPKMRKAIGKALQISKQTIPHFYMRLTIDADPLFAFYRAQKPEAGCTLNDVILLALGRTINAFPAFRSRIEGDELVEFPGANIGVAVGVEEGLVVPVILNVGHMSLKALALETRNTIEAARKGKLQNIGLGTFTVSNLGMFGVEEFSAIINPPEAAIMAISAVREEVLVKDGAMRPGRVMTMTLSSDHRLIDGLLAAQFLGRLKEVLEAPAQLV